ncbi:hypothetical protein HYFRA_00006509 [Hymenoscyphus fraxineus]|uniref:Hydroxyproline-rich glycoprotein n=1 Tax=Hymenoscyphus fraxineus TaxID=746836 RepID=A0A9N9PLG7_9HELO|nr:hypothetical protein HYFRA_00006509 [Hymenoscyphus fraxineus]
MAARPGEELVATLFADVHYYYGPPTAKPPHHRFDKGSYVYLFENPGHRRARLEVANNAGTPDQDAFNGHLDAAHVLYSYKHSTLITLTVDGSNRNSLGNLAENQEWHLPTFDPRNENKYMYKLHTIDLYFWLKEDALQFLNGVRRVLPQPQVTIQDEPIAPPPHQHDMSPVVQRLENVAIADPSYQQGQTRNSQTSSHLPASLTRSSTGNFPGPPIAPVSRSTTFPGAPISATPQSMEATNFVPLAYNPAAPAAPETIHHREKTPPPEDGAGNPLVAAATADQGQHFGNPYQTHGGFSGPPQPQQASYFPGPPATQTPPSQYGQPPPPSAGFQSNFGQPPPPPSAGLQSPYAQHFQNSFAPPPTAPSTSSPYSQPPSAVASAPPPPSLYQHPTPPATTAPHIPVTQQYAQYPLSPGFSSPGLSTPSTSIYSPTNSTFVPGTPLSVAPPPASAPPPPPGGFSQYSYQQQPDQLSNTRPHQTDYSIHQQVYRPTEGEAMKAQKAPKPPGGKLEERAGRLEKGATSLFKRLEKKIG